MISQLLTLDLPKYQVQIPSKKKKTFLRPFLVKEEKVLLQAQETGDAASILKALGEMIQCCVENVGNPYELPLFDIEYLFIKLREKSVDETVSPAIICPESNERIELKINLADIELKTEDEHTNKIKLSETVEVHMKYPTLLDYIDLQTLDASSSEVLYKLIVKCIDKIQTPEELISDVQSLTETEIEEFVNSMTNSQFESILNFFATMPRLEKEVSYETKDGKTKKVLFRGLSDFFLLPSAT